MKHFFVVAILYFIAAGAAAQKSVDRIQFFADSTFVNATFTVNMNRVISHGVKVGYTFPAAFSCRLGDSIDVNDKISVEIRGHFRRGYCYLPPLKLIFNSDANAQLSFLKSLKLVSACKPSPEYEQYIFREYLIYKIYNLITEYSFNVRLLNLNYQDSAARKKVITEHAFLIEDIKDVAKRNDCTEWAKTKVATEMTDRKQMTIVALFEYMIGNTDWAVPVSHNTKLLLPKEAGARPLVVPYDFDYSGLAGTDYAIPDEKLGIESVQERLYRGFSRTMEELNEALAVFKAQKENIYATINNFKLLDRTSKNEMTNYLDGFFNMINNPASVREAFIVNARKQ